MNPTYCVAGLLAAEGYAERKKAGDPLLPRCPPQASSMMLAGEVGTVVAVDFQTSGVEHIDQRVDCEEPDHPAAGNT